jgi:hypothetical protein
MGRTSALPAVADDLAVAAIESDLAAFDIRNHAKSVVFVFEDPLVIIERFICQRGKHRLEALRDGDDLRGFTLLERKKRLKSILPRHKLIEFSRHRGDKRYIRRDAAGRIKESDDVSRSLSQDRRRKAKTVAKPGQGDRGDRKSASKRTSRKKSSVRR